jgi:hypothetical protein
VRRAPGEPVERAGGLLLVQQVLRAREFEHTLRGLGRSDQDQSVLIDLRTALGLEKSV